MFRDPAFCESAIVNQKLSRAVVYDTNRKEKLDYCEAASPDALVDQFRAWLKMLHGPVRIEAWSANGFDEKGGKLHDRNQRCVWLVMGQAGVNDAAPLQPVYQMRTDPAQPVPDISLHVKLATLELELKHERELRVAMEQQDDDDDGDEQEDDDEPAPAQPFGLDAETLKQIRGLFADLLGPKVPAPSAQPIQGTTQAAIGQGPISGDAEFLAAMDAMAKDHPETAAKYREQLLSAYGKKD